MKKILIAAVVLVVAVGSIILLRVNATANTTPSTPTNPSPIIVERSDFEVNTNGAKVGSVNARVNQTTSKRSFVSNGYFADRGYSGLGELDSIEILVSGMISEAECVTYASNGVGGYEDYFKLSIKAPANAKSVHVNGETTVEVDSSKFLSGYLVNDVRWLDGFSHYGKTYGSEKINCFHIAFYGDAVTPISQYFVYITYDLTFVD